MSKVTGIGITTVGKRESVGCLNMICWRIEQAFHGLKSRSYETITLDLEGLWFKIVKLLAVKTLNGSWVNEVLFFLS